MFEEVIVPCHGALLERELMPAIETALFRKNLEPLGEWIRALDVKDAALKAEIQKDWYQLRDHVLHGQIDYPGRGPLPEHWKQFIDREANYYDWRHPKWAQDAEKLLVDAAIRTAQRPEWDGRTHPTQRTTSGFVDLLMEIAEKLPAAKPAVDKFLEGLPEWMQHANAFTGGFLTEDEVGAMLELLTREKAKLEGELGTKAVLPSLLSVLEEAKKQHVGISWTVV
jgi:hypothetical protein